MTKTLQPDDHRIRVGRERSEKMRRRLLAAVMTTYTRCKPPETWVVEDVIHEAGVSRATFYAHFVSLEDAIGVLGQELVEEMLQNLHDIFQHAEAPAVRMVTGLEIFLLRGVTDSLWGEFVSRTEFLSPENPLVKAIALDLEAAKASGAVRFTEIEAAISLFIGAMMEAIRHIVRSGQKSLGYIEEISLMILLGIGMDPAQAQRMVHERLVYIRGLAPEFLPWWRDPWPSE